MTDQDAILTDDDETPTQTTDATQSKEHVTLSDGTVVTELNRKQLVEMGLNAKAKVDALKAEHKEQLKVPTEDHDKLAHECHNRLNQDEENHMAIPDVGRGEIRSRVTYKVVDKEAFSKLIAEGSRWVLTTLASDKKAVDEYIDEFQEIPAGLERSVFKQVVFVRSKK